MIETIVDTQPMMEEVNKKKIIIIDIKEKSIKLIM